MFIKIEIETKFPLTNFFYTEIDFTTSLDCVYLRPIFSKIRLTTCSTISNLFLGGTLNFIPFGDYTRE